MKKIAILFLMLGALQPCIGAASAPAGEPAYNEITDSLLPGAAARHFEKQSTLFNRSMWDVFASPLKETLSRGTKTIRNTTVSFYLLQITLRDGLKKTIAAYITLAKTDNSPSAGSLPTTQLEMLIQRIASPAEAFSYGIEGKIENSIVEGRMESFIPEGVRAFDGDDAVTAYQQVKNIIDATWLPWEPIKLSCGRGAGLAVKSHVPAVLGDDGEVHRDYASVDYDYSGE